MEKVRRKLKNAPDGDRQMVAILGCVATDGLPAVEAACQEALDHGAFSAAVIINILARARDPAPAERLSIPDALRLTHEPVADCARYDSLRRAS
ncbi:Mobile element protein (plasmid) [Sinorhizobium sojae CCBAU 05684]|uniref:Mobile element protein n=1 Tax=Sinorhizobium sojae CCBAU 05684 TaxID=716928 RepID=A0A249PL76_9HYPH|nr:Mobile element protein [Sinorhizobium sojae CCBAU 05684]